MAYIIYIYYIHYLNVQYIHITYKIYHICYIIYIWYIPVNSGKSTGKCNVYGWLSDTPKFLSPENFNSINVHRYTKPSFAGSLRPILYNILYIYFKYNTYNILYIF